MDSSACVRKTESDDASGTTNSTNYQQHPIMPRMLYYKMISKIPRIPKDDNRRNYGFAFLNSLNSCNWLTVYDFLSTFGSSDFRGSVIVRPEGNHLALPQSVVEFRNVMEACEFIFLRLLLSPDITFINQRMVIKVSSNGSAIVEVDVLTSFTALYVGEIVQRTLAADCAIDDGFKVATRHAYQKFHFIESLSMNTAKGQNKKGVTHLPTQARSNMTVKNRIHIDADFRIRYIEYEFTGRSNSASAGTSA